MVMFDANETTKITRDLLIAIGAEVQKGTNKIIDQETKSPLSFETKFIKANTDPTKALYIADNEVKLDPLDPKCTKLLERVFAKFLKDSEEIENLPECVVYYFDKDDNAGKYRLNIKFNTGEIWVGNWYINKVICFDEAIFSLDGTFIETDLRPYDINYNTLGE